MTPIGQILDWSLPSVSDEAVADALQDFSLGLRGDKDVNWVALAARRALAITVPDESDAPNRPSNADIRAELDRLATIASATWLELFNRTEPAAERIFDFAREEWERRAPTQDCREGFADNLPDLSRYKAAIAELDWLANFLRRAALGIERQRGPWVQSEIRQQRIERGHYLAPVFEAAFGEPISVNNWPGDATHAKPTPFMDFYQRMVALAFGEKATPDISGVLKEARRLHQAQPVRFSAGVIPGL